VLDDGITLLIYHLLRDNCVQSLGERWPVCGLQVPHAVTIRDRHFKQTD